MFRWIASIFTSQPHTEIAAQSAILPASTTTLLQKALITPDEILSVNNMPEPVPAVSDGSDALENFLAVLRKEMNTANDVLQIVKTKKIEIIGALPAPSHAGFRKTVSVFGRIAEFFAGLCEEIKESIEPANWNLEDKIANMKLHLEPLREHLTLVEEKMKIATSAEELRALSIEDCDICIEMLDEKIALFDSVIVYINSSLQVEALGELAANAIARFLVDALLHVQLPSVSWVEQYRGNFFVRIEDEVKEFDKIETKVMGETRLAMNYLEAARRGSQFQPKPDSEPAPAIVTPSALKMSK